MWGTTKGFFYYQPGPLDEDHDDILMINYSNYDKINKVLNIVGLEDHMCAFDTSNNFLFVASHDIIKIV